MTFSTNDIATESARLLAALRAKRPLVQCITNFVSMDVVANALLSLGASPAMVHAPQETLQFIDMADALVCNIGTLSQTWVDSMAVAAQAAQDKHKPWVLDPVGAGGTRFRDAAVVRLLRYGPSVIRGNASEIMAVAKSLSLTATEATPKGADSTNTTDEAADVAHTLARHLKCVVAATGAIDLVTDGEHTVRLANGSPQMARVTALGCALSGLVGAFQAVSDDRFMATTAAVAIYGIAGDMAAEKAQRPGSFRVAFIDALDEIDRTQIATRLKLL